MKRHSKMGILAVGLLSVATCVRPDGNGDGDGGDREDFAELVLSLIADTAEDTEPVDIPDTEDFEIREQEDDFEELFEE